MIVLGLVALAVIALLGWLIVQQRKDLAEAHNRLYLAWKEGHVIPYPEPEVPAAPVDPTAEFSDLLKEYIQSFEGEAAQASRWRRAIRLKREGKSEKEIVSILDAPHFL
jgi:hypothetical protein